jgi:hypothetical protein
MTFLPMPDPSSHFDHSGEQFRHQQNLARSRDHLRAAARSALGPTTLPRALIFDAAPEPAERTSARAPASPTTSLKPPARARRRR